MKDSKKALVLLSGGLDSSLCLKIMLDLGIKVRALYFVTPFFSRKSYKSKELVEKLCNKFSVKLDIIEFGDDYVNLVKNPKFGYGSGINPCIDCRIYMFMQAKKHMQKIGADFLVTGEVLGQRPKSQHKKEIKLIETESGLADRILRPLSAKLLDKTEIEKQGIVDRDKLFSIQGRSRKIQMDLAKKLGISEYESPAGGCLLCDNNFEKKLRDYFKHIEKINIKDIYALKYGRHFRINNDLKLIVGRDEEENIWLERYAKDKIACEVVDISGPITVVDGIFSSDDLKLAAEITSAYSDSKYEDKIKVRCGKKELEIKSKDIREFYSYMV